MRRYECTVLEDTLFDADYYGMSPNSNWEPTMKIAKYLAAAAALSTAAVPAIAAPANPAASLSVAKSARAGSTANSKDKLAGGGIIVAVIAAAAVVAGIIIVADDDDDDDSNSN
ncbi:hypothetical protein SAMN05192583_1210 [Sphingomonas gellani]|uniref:Uncharacterized protein n=2 Tax=Sphingomonas gellani TaxID=1166340 RepID=A0A1H8B7R8_9SPHN|nr:hypothetical protein SAMN05192583_1210 [Sphingomonas gellani]